MRKELTEEQKQEVKNATNALCEAISHKLGFTGNMLTYNDILQVFTTSNAVATGIVSFVEGWMAAKGCYPAGYDLTEVDIKNIISAE